MDSLIEILTRTDDERESPDTAAKDFDFVANILSTVLEEKVVRLALQTLEKVLPHFISSKCLLMHDVDYTRTYQSLPTAYFKRNLMFCYYLISFSP